MKFYKLITVIACLFLLIFAYSNNQVTNATDKSLSLKLAYKLDKGPLADICDYAFSDKFCEIVSFGTASLMQQQFVIKRIDIKTGDIKISNLKLTSFLHVIYADDEFVIGCRDGSILTSSDGITWKTKCNIYDKLSDVNLNNNNLISMEYEAGVYYFCTGNNGYVTTKNLVDFKWNPIGNSANGVVGISVSGKNIYISCSDGGNKSPLCSVLKVNDENNYSIIFSGHTNELKNTLVYDGHEYIILRSSYIVIDNKQYNSKGINQSPTAAVVINKKVYFLSEKGMLYQYKLNGSEIIFTPFQQLKVNGFAMTGNYKKYKECITFLTDGNIGIMDQMGKIHNALPKNYFHMKGISSHFWKDGKCYFYERGRNTSGFLITADGKSFSNAICPVKNPQDIAANKNSLLCVDTNSNLFLIKGSNSTKLELKLPSKYRKDFGIGYINSFKDGYVIAVRGCDYSNKPVILLYECDNQGKFFLKSAFNDDLFSYFVCDGNAFYILFGGNMRIYSSKDLVKWSSSDLGGSTDSICGSGKIKNSLYFILQSGDLLTSNDGIKWVKKRLPGSQKNNYIEGASHICYDGAVLSDTMDTNANFWYFDGESLTKIKYDENHWSFYYYDVVSLKGVIYVVIDDKIYKLAN